MSLAPAATVILGNLKYNVHLPQVEVRLGLLPGVNTVQVVLPVGVEISAVAGDAGSLELDGGEGAETVLTGKVRQLRRGLTATEVQVADGGAALSSLRPAATYEKQSAKEVIRALAATANVTVGTLDLDLPLAAYTAHQRRTAAEHIADLTSLAGAVARFDGDGALQVTTLGDRPDLALRYGREIIAYEVREQAVPPTRRIAVGSGPAGSADAPNALHQSLDPVPDDAPAPGTAALWLPTPLLRTPTAAVTASQAADAAVAAGGSRVTARCFLLPALRPGMVVEVQELPHGLAGGPWLLTHVTHRLHPDGGGITQFDGTVKTSEGLGGLLGAALSAVGGFL